MTGVLVSPVTEKDNNDNDKDGDGDDYDYDYDDDGGMFSFSFRRQISPSKYQKQISAINWCDRAIQFRFAFTPFTLKQLQN